MDRITKKDFLEQKYIAFSNEIGAILETNIFPSLSDLCMVDILLFFQYTFWAIDDYRDVVRNLIEVHHQDISDEKFERIYPIIRNYINDLKEFLRNN
jgi:hypothetical protein